MSRHGRFATFVVIGTVVLAARLVLAQGPQTTQNPDAPPNWIPDIKFASGREIVPYLEGWIRNPDESFDFVFGYYNRNQQQELAIPAGPNNSVMPGGPDRGQPTYFLARRQNRVYRVRVPKDWGDKALTWTLTANGHTEKVVAKLVPAYEKDEQFIITGNSTGTTFGEEDPNKPPTISIPTTLSASVGTPLALTALVTDDGLPKPRQPAAPRPTVAPLSPEQARFQSQRNNSGGGRPQLVGPRVTWIQYRGPAKVTLGGASPIQVVDGKATTTASFSVPGTYVLFGTASDGRLLAQTQVTITVK